MKPTSNGESGYERGPVYVSWGLIAGGGCGGGGQLEKLVADSRAWRDLGRGNTAQMCRGRTHPGCSLSPCEDQQTLLPGVGVE